MPVPIDFPKPEVSRVTKAFCALAAFELNHPRIARGIIVAVIGVILLFSAGVERAA